MQKASCAALDSCSSAAHERSPSQHSPHTYIKRGVGVSQIDIGLCRVRVQIQKRVASVPDVVVRKIVLPAKNPHALREVQDLLQSDH